MLHIEGVGEYRREIRARDIALELLGTIGVIAATWWICLVVGSL